MAPDVDVLLVEDDPRDAELVLRAFQKRSPGRSVRVASDGAAALQLLLPAADRGTATWPRLVLLDLKLPCVSGLEVLRQLKADPRTRALPVVVLTSSREAADVEAAYACGASSYLCKPMEFETLVELVDQVGKYWLILNVWPGG